MATIYNIRPTLAQKLSIQEVQDRLASSFTVKDNGCWDWHKGEKSSGYGLIGLWNKQFGAHRVLYELINGTAQKDKQIDHLCRNRACVNPSHMELVDKDTNNIRGMSPSAIHARKTQCPQGHQYNNENTARWSNGPDKPISRKCKVCVAKRCKDYYNRVYKYKITNATKGEL